MLYPNLRGVGALVFVPASGMARGSAGCAVRRGGELMLSLPSVNVRGSLTPLQGQR